MGMEGSSCGMMTPAEAMLISDRNDGMFGGSGSWVFLLFVLLLLGGRGFGFGGGVGSEANFVNNDFLYTNLNNSIDRGFTQVSNQNFGLQKDLCEGFGAVRNDLCNGFHGMQSQIAENRFAAQQCCCETNRNIDAVRYENAKNTCDITSAIHAEGEATRALINHNTMQELRDQLQAAQLQLGNISQTNTLISALRPCPVPAYPSCSPYQAFSWGDACGLGCCGR